MNRPIKIPQALTKQQMGGGVWGQGEASKCATYQFYVEGAGGRRAVVTIEKKKRGDEAKKH